MHRVTDRFRKCLEKLPRSVQAIAKRNFELLKENPSHPSLHFKKVGKFWSARVGLHHRALAVPDGEHFTWVWLGTHGEYEDMIKRTR